MLNFVAIFCFLCGMFQFLMREKWNKQSRAFSFKVLLNQNEAKTNWFVLTTFNWENANKTRLHVGISDFISDQLRVWIPIWPLPKPFQMFMSGCFDTVIPSSEKMERSIRAGFILKICETFTSERIEVCYDFGLKLSWGRKSKVAAIIMLNLSQITKLDVLSFNAN